jgi:hypothetical protein
MQFSSTDRSSASLIPTSEVPMSDVLGAQEGSMSQIDGDSKSMAMFRSQFVDSMEMYADAETVAAYLDAHPEWFRRCAAPLMTEALGDNGYVVTIGRYGNFGFELEPKVGLHLLPQDQGVYRIETLSVPNYVPLGYDVDFKAALELVEHDPDAVSEAIAPEAKHLTKVEWTLDLTVSIQFPKFILALPQGLVERTGEALLEKVVQQISRRLTRKVQEDFHTTRQLPTPKPPKRWLFG